MYLNERWKNELFLHKLSLFLGYLFFISLWSMGMPTQKKPRTGRYQGRLFDHILEADNFWHSVKSKTVLVAGYWKLTLPRTRASLQVISTWGRGGSRVFHRSFGKFTRVIWICMKGVQGGTGQKTHKADFCLKCC